MIDFDTWFSEQCDIDAAEVTDPGSMAHEELAQRYYDDCTRREAALIRYQMMTGNHA